MTDFATVTVAEIEAHAAERRRINHALSAIGRRIYEIRNGEPLKDSYNFHKYALTKFEGHQYCGQEEGDTGGETYAIGTPLVELNYFWSWSGGGETAYVTFPQSYLEADWDALETARVAAMKHAAEEAERIAAEERKVEAAASRRRQYERLKAEFEGGAAS
jgi:hypothetical protein